MTLNGGTLQDSGGASAALGLGTRAITNDPAHKVHTPPRVTGVSIISNPGVNGTYDAGESILLRVSFSETTSETGTSQVALDIGANTRRAARWFDPNGALRGNLYQYTVTADDFDGDGISVRSDALTLTQGARLFALWDSETAVLSLGSHAIANDSAHTVRDNAPGFPHFGRQNVVAGTAASITLPAATDGDGAITYALAPTTMPDGLTFNLATRRITGTPTAQAVAPAATYTWTATDADGDSTPLTFTIAVAAADAPKVRAVGFRSSPRAQNTYDANAMNPIAVFVQFDKFVRVTGTPQLDLEIGDETVQASWFGKLGSDWTTQIFTYSVKAGDRDSDGISIRPGALSLNGGTMRCLVPSASNCATAMDAALGLGSHAITNDALHKVNGGVNIPPAVKDVEIVRTVMTAPPSNVYKAGDRIIINVKFSENVTLIGSPTIGLRVGDDSRRAAFRGVVRTNPANPYRILQFEYTFLPTDSDSDGISILDTLDDNGVVTTHALNLNGGTLRDSGGADAVLDLGTHAITNDASFKVSSPPKITGVSVISTPIQSGTYTWASLLRIAIDYDQPVTFTPSAPGATGMRLSVGIDSGDKAIHPAGSDTSGSRIAFAHTVENDDVDANGVSLAAAALNLNGGTLQSADGETATTDLTGFTFANNPSAKLDGTKAKLWPVLPATLTLPNPTAGSAYSTTLPAPGGDAPLQWSVSPSLPQGLVLNAATGAISGTPSAQTPLMEYTVTVEDGAGVPASGTGGFDFANGDTASAKFRMRVQGANPYVTGVSFASSPQTGDTYGRGEEAVVSVAFSGTGISVEGAPTLKLKIGSVEREAAYLQTDANANALQFRYTIQASDVDTDGISVEAGALSVGAAATIRDSGGRNAVLPLGVHAIANSASHKANGGITRAPTVLGATLITAPALGDTFKRGEEIEIRVEFSQAVSVSGSPTLGLAIGSATRQAAYVGVGSSPRHHYFRYAVQTADVDNNGFGTSANALAAPSGSHIRSAAGQNAEAGVLATARTLSSWRKINGGQNDKAVIKEVRLTSRPALGDTYKLGETIRAQLRFSKAVTVTGTPRLTILIGAAQRQASYVRTLRERGAGLNSPEYQWVEFSYAVQSGDYDADGVSVQKIDANRGTGLGLPFYISPLSAPSGSNIVGTSDGGLAVDLRFRRTVTTVRVVHGFGSGFGWRFPTVTIHDVSQSNIAGHKVNGRQPTVSSFEFRGIPRNITRCNDPVLPPSTNPGCDTPPWTRTPGGYLEGETIGTLTTFSEPVRISGTPALTLTMESGSVTATAWGYYYPARNNHTKLWIQYVVQADDYDTNGVSVARTALAMQSGVIRSRATGNPAILTLPSALGDQPYQTVLRTPPAPARITNIGFRADTRPFANNTYERDETIYLGVLFDRPVNLAGSRPTLSLTIGANTRAATYSGIVSGGRLITFEYLVQAGDLDADGASLPANALNLNGGTITTRSNSLAANIASDAVGNDAGRKVNGGVDGPPKPTHLAIISSPVVGNTYGTGERIRARLHFHKRIAVTGSPQLALSLTSETVQMAKYGTLSATTIDFAYTVKTTDRDADGLSVAANALALNGGTIRSHSGASNASLNLGSRAITNAGDHRVDGRVRNVPSFGSAVVSDKSWRVNTAVSDTLPASQGGRGSVTYALSPALPSGMSFNTSTLRIYGTARAVTARTQYTLTARDSHGATAQLRFYIAITANPVPTFGAATISDKSWTANAAITGFTLPAATGGDGALTLLAKPEPSRRRSPRLDHPPSKRNANRRPKPNAVHLDGDGYRRRLRVPNLRHNRGKRRRQRPNAHIRRRLDSRQDVDAAGRHNRVHASRPRRAGMEL